MTLPTTITKAYQQHQLLILWSQLPFPLSHQPVTQRAVVLTQWLAQLKTLPGPDIPLPELPPLPILSLDPTNRVEEAFAAAEASLHLVRSRRDVPVGSRHNLLKLAGDLAGRSGVVLSRDEISHLPNDPDKGHLLAEARRIVEEGVLLVVSADPGNEDFQAWWSMLWPVLGQPAAFALGRAQEGWPAEISVIEEDFDALVAHLRAHPPAPEQSGLPASALILSRREELQRLIQLHHRRLQKRKEQQAYYGISTPPEILIEIEDIKREIQQLQAALHAPSPVSPDPHSKKEQAASSASAEKYNITFEGPVTGVVVGDENQVTQQFEGQDISPVLKAWLARIDARLAQGLADLKRGQQAIYRRANQTQQDELTQIEEALREGRLAQAEMQAALGDLRRAMKIILNRGAPMDAELRAAVEDLTELVESSLSLDQKLELALPLIPLILNYKIELGAGSDLDLHDLADKLSQRWARWAGKNP